MSSAFVYVTVKLLCTLSGTSGGECKLEPHGIHEQIVGNSDILFFHHLIWKLFCICLYCTIFAQNQFRVNVKNMQRYKILRNIFFFNFLCTSNMYVWFCELLLVGKFTLRCKFDKLAPICHSYMIPLYIISNPNGRHQRENLMNISQQGIVLQESLIIGWRAN